MSISGHFSIITSWFLSQPKTSGLIVFIILTIPAIYTSSLIFDNTKKNEINEINRIIRTIENDLDQTLNYARLATFTISLTIDPNGVPHGFDSISAQMLKENDYLDALQLVPGGVIKYTYPAEGNEAAMGYDILNDPKRNKEAYKAIELNEMYYAGPLELKQGGLAVIGRLPIYINDKFWGFSASIIKLKRLLENSRIDNTGRSGYYYQFSKVNPNTQKEEFFLTFNGAKNLSEYKSFTFPEGNWKLYLIPTSKYKMLFALLPFSITSFILALLSSLFVTALLTKPKELRKLVLKKLEESESKFEILTSHAPVGIFITAVNGECSYTNEKWREYSGMTADEAMGFGWANALHPDDKERVFKEWNDSVKENKPFSSDYRFIDKNKNIYWLKGSSSALVSKENEVYGYIGTIVDFTSQIKIENELKYALSDQESLNQRFETVLKATNDAIWDWNVETNQTWGNSKLYELYGLDKEKDKLSHDIFLSKLHPDDVDRVHFTITNALENSKRSITNEFRFKIYDGSYRTFLDRGYIMFGEDGNPLRVIGVMQDITERKLNYRYLKQLLIPKKKNVKR